MGKRVQQGSRLVSPRAVLCVCLCFTAFVFFRRGSSSSVDDTVSDGLDIPIPPQQTVDVEPQAAADVAAGYSSFQPTATVTQQHWSSPPPDQQVVVYGQSVPTDEEPSYTQFVRAADFNDVSKCKEFHLKLKETPVYSNMSCIDRSFPKQVFQTLKAYQPQNFSWMNNCSLRSVIQGLPDFAHHIYDDTAARLFVKQEYPEYFELYQGFGTNVERGDFWRYLAIYHYGGLYIDADCCIMKHLKDWIHPSKCGGKEPVRVIVGIEAAVGRNPQKVFYPRLPWELCQWAFAAAPRHPFLQIVVRRIADFVHVEKQYNLTLDWYGSILNRTGPGVFTDGVEEYLLRFNATLSDIGRGNKQIGDMFILPADGFACRNGHSGARGCFNSNPGICVKHLYANSWHKGRKKPTSR